VNLVLIAACNPYRKSEKKTATYGVGLTPHASVNVMVNTDDIQYLVYPFSIVFLALYTKQHFFFYSISYRVYPLPETMRQYVWDFGALDDKAQKDYIHSIVKQFCKVHELVCQYVLM
jgi:hypothetical protein